MASKVVNDTMGKECKPLSRARPATPEADLCVRPVSDLLACLVMSYKPTNHQNLCAFISLYNAGW